MADTESKAAAFLAELEAVCRKHGLSLSHEDKGGNFIVTDFSEEMAVWLKEAVDRVGEPHG